MKKLHMKGYILCLLDEYRDGLWDYEIAQKVLAEYRHSGDYWLGEIRVTLTDLFSGALLEEVEDRLDDGEYFGAGKILVKFRLTSFGRKRMIETGLLPR
ncbi:MAG: hypothetical protein GY815_00360 [Gammaproteobacteria bacterium]|nr:hypothetical protein [Gammaproteobacteria bacterium]